MKEGSTATDKTDIHRIEVDPFVFKNESLVNYQIVFKISDQNLWRNFIKFVHGEINKKIKLDYAYLINKNLMNEKNFLQFLEEDMKTNIEFIKKKNSLISVDRLSFLTDQTNIARELDIKVNVDLDIRQDINYYLRGYQMIEKEIEIINKRNIEDEESYILKNLINDYENRKLISLRDIDRLDMLFKQTPINSNNFKAATIDLNSTNYVSDKKTNLKIFLTAFPIGLLISILYIVSLEAIGNRLKLLVK